MITVYIYTLENPINNEIFYVGQTIAPQVRLSTHIIDVAGRDNTRKGKIIKSILDAGFAPKMDILDEIECKYHEDEDYVNRMESYWMHQLKAWGYQLCNKNGLESKSADRRRLERYLEESPKTKISHAFGEMICELEDITDEILAADFKYSLQKYFLFVLHVKAFSELWDMYEGQTWNQDFSAEHMRTHDIFEPALPILDKIESVYNKHKGIISTLKRY